MFSERFHHAWQSGRNIQVKQPILVLNLAFDMVRVPFGDIQDVSEDGVCLAALTYTSSLEVEVPQGPRDLDHLYLCAGCQRIHHYLL